MTENTRHFVESIYLSKQVPVPAFVLFNEQITPALLKHYARLRILAYSHAFNHTDLLAVSFVAEFLDIDISTLSRALAMLQSASVLTATRPSKGNLVIHFVDVPAGDVYLLPDHTLTNAPDVAAEALAEAQVHFKGKMSTEQMHAYAELIKRGVYAAPAFELVKSFAVLTVLEYCEIYDWALQVSLAKGAGWLRKAISEQWEMPTDYVAPADRCQECGGPVSLAIHHKRCQLNWKPLGLRHYQAQHDCPTCAADLRTMQHATACWRGLYGWTFETLTVQTSNFKAQPNLGWHKNQINIVNGWREVAD